MSNNASVVERWGVSSFQMKDASLPPLIQQMVSVLQGKQPIDDTFTYQPSVLPVLAQSVGSTCLDECGMLWAATSKGLIRFAMDNNDRSEVQSWPSEVFQGELRWLTVIGEHIWILTDEQVYRIAYMEKGEQLQYSDSHISTMEAEAARPGYGVLAEVKYRPAYVQNSLQKEMSYYSAEQFASNEQLSVQEKQQIYTGWVDSQVIPDRVLLDVIGREQVTCFIEREGVMWIGTKRGLLRIAPREAKRKPNPNPNRNRIQFFAGPRYIYGGDDAVVSICADEAQGIWVQNQKGIVHLQLISRTLQQKAAVHERLIETVHDRRGMITEDTYFTRNGHEKSDQNSNLSSDQNGDQYEGHPETDDNDGLWSSEYAIGEIYRYLVMKQLQNEEEMLKAKRAAIRATKAVLLLTQISGRADGFPVRSYITTDESLPDGLWFRKLAADHTGRRYAVAMLTQQAAWNKVPHFVVSDPVIVQEAKLTYKQYTGRDYDTDWGAELGTTGVYPVIVDRENEENVVWQLRSEIIEEVDPILAELYTAAGYQDDQIIYKADTSSDEIVGHSALYYFAYRYLLDGDTAEEMELRSTLVKLADRLFQHIITRGYRLEDAHGNVTTWGKWYASYLSEQGRGSDDSSLNAVELMSFVRVGMYITEHEPGYEQSYKLYTDVYRRLWDEAESGLEDGRGYVHLLHQYIERKTMYLRRYYGQYTSDRQLLGNTTVSQNNWKRMVNYSDENLFACSFLPLIELELEQDINSHRVAHLRGLWLQWWGNMKREQNPFYIFIHQYTFPEEDQVDLDTAVWMLERMLQHHIYFPANVSERADVLLLDEANYRDRGVKSINRPLPPDETYFYKFNSPPFQAHHGMEKQADQLIYQEINYESGKMCAGTWFTLPYWMGRYLGMISGE